ncbi:MAG: hypothetical protein CL489_07000 [Acidobacteria bacterium]|nr:hypothetical protein [Acidobacteriota bacterium]
MTEERLALAMIALLALVVLALFGITVESTLREWRAIDMCIEACDPRQPMCPVRCERTRWIVGPLDDRGEAK